MDTKTLEALEGSIKKWEAIVAGTGKDEGHRNCPLCILFFMDGCVGCPVAQHARQDSCNGTPYDDYRKAEDFDADQIDAARLDAARRELAFLRSLRPMTTAHDRGTK